MDNIKKVKRTARLISVLSKYGFETIISETGIRKLIPEKYINKDEKTKEVFSLTIFERIRMVLEELGPTYVKLGQLLSNRDDLLPAALTVELQKLQDEVPPESMDLYAVLHKKLRIDVDDTFEQIDITPIAAASLSQVYTAMLRDEKKKVVIKVKREGIYEMIESDLLIMKDFSSILEKYYDVARKMGLSNIVNAFEKSIISELSFTQELQNIERFRNNFPEEPDIYIPQTYKNLSNNDILCMEFIDGIKVSEKDVLIEKGLDVKIVAERVVDLYLKQIIEFGFFHADPHSGNIFVLEDGRICFIDYGSVGRMMPSDKEFLAKFLLAGLRKDTKALIRVIKKIAVRYNIENELQLERDLYDLIDIADSSSVRDLDLNDLYKRFSKLLNENQIILPDYIYLLIRGIVLLEGIGRELGLETNLIDYVKPYKAKMIEQQLNPKTILNKFMSKTYNWYDRLEELPDDIHSLIRKVNHDDLKITHSINGINEIKNTINRLVLSILISSLAIGSSIMILADMPPRLWNVSVLGFLGFTSSGILAIGLIFSILRNKN